MKEKEQKPNIEQITQKAIKLAKARRFEGSNPFVIAFSYLVGGGGQYDKGIKNGILETEGKNPDNSQNGRFLNYSVQFAALLALLAAAFLAVNLISVVTLVVGSAAGTGLVSAAIFGFRSHMLQKGKNLVQEEYEQLYQEELIDLKVKKEILEAKSAGKSDKKDLSSDVANLLEKSKDQPALEIG